MPADLLTLARPRQWTKNLAVFAAIIFAGRLTDPVLLVRVCLAFVALCLVSAGMYAFNDAIDAERDRLHPVKCDRPVASGRIGKASAYAFAAACELVGITLSVALGWPFFVTVATYVVLHVLYSVWLKHITIVDMLAIAAGFVLRAVGGAAVISVPVSPWLILCTGLLALFLVAAKRRHETVLLQQASAGHRPVLSDYSAELLDSFMVTLSAATVTSYALYTFFEGKAPHSAMMLTIPFVVYGVLRYQLLVLTRGGGGRPDEVLLTDRPIIIDLALWIASAVFVIYVLPRFVR